MLSAIMLRKYGYASPEKFAIKKLVALSDLVRKFEKNEIVTRAVLDHSSRATVMSSGGENYFGETLEKLQ